MIQCIIESIEPKRATKYSFVESGDFVSFGGFLDRMIGSADFRQQFNQQLAESEFSGFRWETPGITSFSLNRPFEFVLLNASGFANRKTDDRTYRKYFDQSKEGVVVFSNLSGDATLVVPCPRTDAEAYGHLAAFVRQAPQDQVDAFWQMVAKTAQSKIGKSPVWLSTAGGGVAWLHVRLDQRPKYYGHVPYRAAPGI